MRPYDMDRARQQRLGVDIIGGLKGCPREAAATHPGTGRASAALRRPP